MPETTSPGQGLTPPVARARERVRSRTRRTVGVLVGALALSLGLACSPGGPGPGPAPQPASTARDRFADVPLVPGSGVYLGAYYGDRSPAATDAALGRTPQIHLTYAGWEDAWTTDDVIGDDVARGQISLINWEPFGVDLADVVAGEHDELLLRRAREAAALPHEVFVDLAAEMNEEEGWGDHDPALYVAAYRHVHDLFEGRDGGKVVWVWAPNNVDSEGAPGALDYYPGDAYVDWTGIDGYNWGTSEPGFAWQSFSDVFGDMYGRLHALGKPVIIGETASAEEGGSKTRWIADVAPTVRQELPDIRAVVWFDVDKERDWRLRSSDASLDAFRTLAADPMFSATVR